MRTYVFSIPQDRNTYNKKKKMKIKNLPLPSFSSKKNSYNKKSITNIFF